jgi:hypothetical protein
LIGFLSIINDLETGLSKFNSLIFQTIQQLLALGGPGESPFTISSLSIHSSSFLLLFILAYGIATPGGIFMPSIMVSILSLVKFTVSAELLSLVLVTLDVHT